MSAVLGVGSIDSELFAIYMENLRTNSKPKANYVEEHHFAFSMPITL